jgi:hypothetical protein
MRRSRDRSQATQHTGSKETSLELYRVLSYSIVHAVLSRPFKYAGSSATKKISATYVLPPTFSGSCAAVTSGYARPTQQSYPFSLSHRLTTAYKQPAILVSLMPRSVLSFGPTHNRQTAASNLQA